MINKSSPCETVLAWALDHRNEPLPADLQRHCDQCEDCRDFLQQEKWIVDTVQQQARLAPTTLSPEYFARVYTAIQETSDRLTVPVKQGFVWRRVVISVATAFVMAFTGFWFLPLFHGETYLANKMNQQMRTLLQYKAPVIESVTIAQAEQTLQFASRYFTTNEEKTFYYTNDHFTYEELLWIQWLVKRTGAQYSQIAEEYQSLSPVRLLNQYHISAKEAVPVLKNILDQYRQSIALADMTVDGIIERIDYYSHQIWLDTLPDPIEVDANWMNIARIKSYVQVKLQKTADQWKAIQILESHFSTVILNGTLDSVNASQLVLRDNPVVIEWNARTICTSALQDMIDKPVKIRVLPDKDKSIALTVKEQPELKQRTITGLLDSAYQTGFTLKDLHQSFLLSSNLTDNPRVIDPQFKISVTGEDYGEYFIVTELTLIAPPVENNDILLVSAAPVSTPPSQQKTATITRKTAPSKSITDSSVSTDWIVGLQNGQYLLAGGTTLPKANYTIPVGSKITKKSVSTNRVSIQSNEINEITVHHIRATLSNRLSNGVYLFRNEQQKKIVYYTEKTLPYLNQKVQIQGRCIEYPELIILIDGRIFQTQNAKTMTGLVIREMERGKIFLLENGTIFRIDALTAIQNGPVSVGKTVKITGLEEHNTFTTYTVEVQREYAIFTGKITEINRTEKWCRIDSGKQFYWTSEAQLSLILQALDSGKVVYCKAYYENQQWMIENLTFSQGEPGEQT